MAKSRENPYIWVKWLARVMSGELNCQWQAWFQTHNLLTTKQPTSFDLVSWGIDHTKMLTELLTELKTRGLTPRLEYPFKLQVKETTLSGKIDCLVIEDFQATVYDCKTGTPRSSDQVQVMIYMYAIARLQGFKEENLRGIVAYRIIRMWRSPKSLRVSPPILSFS